MKKLIHMDYSNTGRLCCDNLNCLHELPASLPWSKDLIGHPCPKCGVSMLSPSEYKYVERYRQVVNFINLVGSWFGLGYEPDDPELTEISIKFKDKQL